MSHETIYRSLFVQARGALKQELIGHLRSKRRIRRSRHATDRGLGRGEIIDAISIRQRPAEADDRAVPGHWEGDLVEGSRGTYIATLVERRSRFVILVKLSEAGWRDSHPSRALTFSSAHVWQQDRTRQLMMLREPASDADDGASRRDGDNERAPARQADPAFLA